MSSLVSRLVSSLSSSQHSPAPPSQVLSLRKSTKNPELTIIHTAGRPADTFPLYSVTASKATDPNLLVFKGGPDPPYAIGDARWRPSSSSTADLMLHGQAVRMETSRPPGNWIVRHPTMGDLKWRLNQLTRSPLELVDGAGKKLARLRSAGIRGAEKRLEILVPCLDSFVDLVVLSGMTVRFITKSIDEAVVEALVAGGDASAAAA